MEQANPILIERRGGVAIVSAAGDPAAVPVSAALLQAVENMRREPGLSEVIEVWPGLVFVHHRASSGSDWTTVDLVGDQARAYLAGVRSAPADPAALSVTRPDDAGGV